MDHFAIDFEMLAIAAGNPEIHMEVAAGTLRASLTIKGGSGKDYNGANVTVEIDAGSLPEGWSSAAAHRAFTVELRRPVSVVGGIPAGLHRALVSGAAMLEVPVVRRRPKALPKSTKCRGCGKRTVQVFLAADHSIAQYDCRECACQDKRVA